MDDLLPTTDANLADWPLAENPWTDADWRQPVATLAARLLGAYLGVDGVGGWIVETEAYHPADPASHSFTGRTRRNAAMFGPVGTVYVYRSYGIHWCLNLVGGEVPGAAVLVRALCPSRGASLMAARRGGVAARGWCSGPGKLAQALGVHGGHNGQDCSVPPWEFSGYPRQPQGIRASRRIGIRRGVETLWRFTLAGCPWCSRPEPRRRDAQANADQTERDGSILSREDRPSK